MAECLACEKQFDTNSFENETDLYHRTTYCSLECETIFEAALKESAEDSKIRGLVDVDGNSILGGAYQQAVQRTIREAASRIGIKLPDKE